MRLLLAAVLACTVVLPSRAQGVSEDGYDLWLRYRLIEDDTRRADYAEAIGRVVVPDRIPTLDVVAQELERAISAMTGRTVTADRAWDVVTPSGRMVLAGTPTTDPAIAELDGLWHLETLGPEGYVVRSARVRGADATVIASTTDIGVLYGTFHFLRLLQTGRPIRHLDIVESPRLRLRVLNHWDNLDRFVERGYAGESIWDWHRLPEYLPERYTDYARANASLGINGTVITNVNANALVLTEPYLRKAAALARVFRPYGIRVYLTARFSAPVEIGGLETADPLDPAVRAWWAAKADEIYGHIPDFGGFLVKANSEGQPGPQDYDRTQADGANMLADAVGPHGGVVMWRAFVYTSIPEQDRAGQAVDEFVPLDGQFRDNVLVQVKNGPIDFQPREPFHPLFGAMPRTPLMMEFQITKEYLGLATHLVYLGPLFAEVLNTDTRVQGEGSTVARVIDGSLEGHALTGMAGVSNVGSDRNWCGSHFDCANWYAFGRLAWNPLVDVARVAEEWLKMTFTTDLALVEPMRDLMMESHEVSVDYRTPLGLHHIMAAGHHYGPGPWVSGMRPDWTSVYYHRADTLGIGFDRTATGSGTVAQYAPEVSEIYGDVDRVPEELLLWFHHVPWEHEMASGRTLWDEMALRYQRGVDGVRRMQEVWHSMRSFVDAARWRETASLLAIQEREARWWRDACLLYFQTFSRRPLPEGVEPPEHTLDHYMNLRSRYVPGQPG